MDQEDIEGQRRESHHQRQTQILNKNFIVSIIVIIVLSPVYGYGIYLYRHEPRKLALVIISYVITVPWWLSMAMAKSLETVHREESRKWRGVAAILQIIQAILPVACLDWWDMPSGDAYFTWGFTVFYFVLALSMHYDLLTNQEIPIDDGVVQPGRLREIF